MSKTEMSGKLNPDGVVVKFSEEHQEQAEFDTGSEKVAKFSTEPWFKPKTGSVTPARGRSVKRMMFDYFFQSTTHPVHPRPPSSSPAATQPGKANSCSKKSSPVHPQTP